MAMSHKYKGVLGKRAGSIAWLLGNERTMIQERLDALFRDFGMEPAHDSISLFKLLVKLAERHVPGFDRADARGRGQPGKGIDIDLILEFERRIQGGRLSIAAVAPHVRKALGRSNTPTALAAAYARAIKKLHPDEREAINEILRRQMGSNTRRGK
jgi:hypothetical protein